VKISFFQRLAETLIICVSGLDLGKFSVEHQFARWSNPGGFNQLNLKVLVKISFFQRFRETLIICAVFETSRNLVSSTNVQSGLHQVVYPDETGGFN
jgi:hypothetical protein